jgi:Cu(I)/Ag(I) efflux system membrane fusion protein
MKYQNNCRMKWATAAVCAWALAALIAACSRSNGPTPTEQPKQGEQAVDYWTCPMHPEVHTDKQGNCPKCHMKLTPVYKSGANK